jgi:hypothetical protein
MIRSDGLVSADFLAGWHVRQPPGRRQFPPAPRAHPACTSFQVAMMLTGLLQMLAPVLPPKARAWKV